MSRWDNIRKCPNFVEIEINILKKVLDMSLPHLPGDLVAVEVAEISEPYRFFLFIIIYMNIRQTHIGIPILESFLSSLTLDFYFLLLLFYFIFRNMFTNEKWEQFSLWDSIFCRIKRWLPSSNEVEVREREEGEEFFLFFFKGAYF